MKKINLGKWRLPAHIAWSWLMMEILSRWLTPVIDNNLSFIPITMLCVITGWFPELIQFIFKQGRYNVQGALKSSIAGILYFCSELLNLIL